AGEEDLVGVVQLPGPYVPFVDGDPQIPGERQDRLPGDAVEEGVRDRRVQGPAGHQEEIGPGGLRQVSPVVQEQGVVAAGRLRLVAGQRADGVQRRRLRPDRGGVRGRAPPPGRVQRDAAAVRVAGEHVRPLPGGDRDVYG